MSGWVGHEADWGAFEPRWASVLKKFGLTEFHMNECAQWKGEFAAWNRDEERRKALLSELILAIRSSKLIAVGANVDLATYRWFNERFFIEERLGTPYSVSAWLAVARVHGWAQERGLSEPLHFYIERGDNEQSDLRKSLDERRHSPPPRPLLAPR